MTEYTASDLLAMADELSEMYIELANLKIQREEPLSEFDKEYLANNSDRFDRHIERAKNQILEGAAKKKFKLDAQIIMLEAKIRGAELRYDAVRTMVFSHAQ